MHKFSENGDGWFEANLGMSASKFVSRLRKARRHNKDDKDSIDGIINDVRMLKGLEVELSLKMFPWCEQHSETIRELGLSERNLKSLRRFGDSRKVNLQQACRQWEAADDALKMLESYEDVWGEKQRDAWVNSMQMKKDARKMWSTALHQI